MIVSLESGARPQVERKFSLIVEVPANVRGKDKLLRYLADKLRFPSYFSGNWDSFDECISDLSWLSESPVLVAHIDPYCLGGEELATYLEIMRSAINERNGALCVLVPVEWIQSNSNLFDAN